MSSIKNKGRKLPTGVCKRKDGRYVYRIQRRGKKYYLYDDNIDELIEKIEILKFKLDVKELHKRGKMTLIEYYPKYLETYKKGKIKEGSYCNMVGWHNNHIKPYEIGNIAIKDITRQTIIKHFQFLADEKGLAKTTLESIASAIKCAVEELLMDNIIASNPFRDVMKYVSARGSIPVVALERDEQDELMSYLRKPGFQNAYLPIIGTLLGTGMRIGEATGLTWNDIDFDNRVIHVCKSMNYRDRGNGYHEYYITSPKSDCSNRNIPISSEVNRLLLLQRERQIHDEIPQNVIINEYDNNGNIIAKYSEFVFTTKKGMPFSDGLGSNLSRIVENHNKEEIELSNKEGREPFFLPEMHAHQFRHTFCTRIVEGQIKAGVTNFHAIKALMGHTKLQTSIDIYTSITREMHKLYAEDVEGIL